MTFPISYNDAKITAEKIINNYESDTSCIDFTKKIKRMKQSNETKFHLPYDIQVHILSFLSNADKLIVRQVAAKGIVYYTHVVENMTNNDITEHVDSLLRLPETIVKYDMVIQFIDNLKSLDKKLPDMDRLIDIYPALHNNQLVRINKDANQEELKNIFEILLGIQKKHDSINNNVRSDIILKFINNLQKLDKTFVDMIKYFHHLLNLTNTITIMQKLCEFGYELNLCVKDILCHVITHSDETDRDSLLEIFISHDDCDLDELNDYGMTPLVVAINHKFEKSAIILMRRGADVNIVDPYNNTPLMYACINDCSHIALLLLSKMDKSLINNKSRYSLESALYYAVRENNHIVVDALLQAGADSNVVCNRLTPLQTTLIKNHSSIVNVLLQYGADNNVVSNGFTPLYHAVIKNHSSIVNVLLQYGADSNIIYNERTLLLLACEMEYWDITNLLIPCIDKSIINMSGQLNRCALWFAVNSNKINIVTKLLTAGANNFIHYDTTLLIIACKSGYWGVVAELIQHIDKSLINNLDDDDRTALWYAVKNKQYDIIKSLLALDVSYSMNMPDKIMNKTPVDLAVESKFDTVVQKFLKINFEYVMIVISQNTEKHIVITNKLFEEHQQKIMSEFESRPIVSDELEPPDLLDTLDFESSDGFDLKYESD
jgi:ankyrin repeat protein